MSDTPDLATALTDPQWSVITEAIAKWSRGEQKSDLVALGIVAQGVLVLDEKRRAALAAHRGGEGWRDFDTWWLAEGRFLDPDTEDVPWFDKRKGLAELAFRAGAMLASAPQPAAMPAAPLARECLEVVRRFGNHADDASDYSAKGEWPVPVDDLRAAKPLISRLSRIAEGGGDEKIKAVVAAAQAAIDSCAPGSVPRGTGKLMPMPESAYNALADALASLDGRGG